MRGLKICYANSRQGLYDKTAGFALRRDPCFRARVNGITMKQ